MAPKKKTTTKNNQGSPPPEMASAGGGMFSGMVVFLVPVGVRTRRLEIWKQKLQQMGAAIEDRLTKSVTHVFAMNSDSLLRPIDADRLSRFQGLWFCDMGKKRVLLYRWLEDSLTSGEKVSEDMYDIKAESESEAEAEKAAKRKSSDEKEEPKEQEDDQGSDTLGDDRRSFSYYKAIPVIEKLPFKIESAEQIRHLPSIGKSMQDHIQEIVTTGKLSKLEHFETDEKVLILQRYGPSAYLGKFGALVLPLH
ncbi:hypothetical protein TIFTF001_039973 [Ficus carica]|uniref:BRCT domain-containing protein n=1 Tax=Ficus carica TaxID=3494 RepID=A0AA87YXR1_FICCA|nr:hypothetical protein TIFTF001_039973 [Ficus carica]